MYSRIEQVRRGESQSILSEASDEALSDERLKGRLKCVTVTLNQATEEELGDGNHSNQTSKDALIGSRSYYTQSHTPSFNSVVRMNSGTILHLLFLHSSGEDAAFIHSHPSHTNIDHHQPLP